jgi:hypothetical protein
MMPIGRAFERRGLLLVPTDPTNPNPNPNPDWFNSLPVERKKEVMAGGLGVRLLEEGLSYVMPIFWLGVDEEAGTKLTNGTAFLIDCGQGVFAVTAAHVHTAYRDGKRGATDVACQIGDMLFDPEAHLIDCDVRDGGCDIATFRLSPEDVAKINKPVLRSRPGEWPPRPADVGNFAFFAGYPGVSRDMSPGGHYFAAAPYRAVTPITTINERQITCRYDRDHMLDLGGQGLPPIGHDIRGVSGAPLLIPTLEARGIRWRVGGVIVEAAPGELFEQVVAVRADYILPDGRLQRAV